MDSHRTWNWFGPFWQDPEPIELIRKSHFPKLALTIAVTLLFGITQAALWEFIRPLYFFFFYPAIVVSVFLWGFSAGLFSTLISLAIVSFYFLGREAPAMASQSVALSLFCGTGILLSAFTGFFLEKHRRLTAKRLEENLQRMGDGYLILDHELRYRYVNQRTLEIMGKNRDEVVGRTYLELWPDLVHTDFDKKVRSTIKDHSPQSFEFHHSPTDRWFELHLYPTYHGVSIYVREISERKSSEVQLQARAREALDTNTKLIRTVKELERSNHELAQFAHAASHDMKEPLRMVSNFVQLLAENYGDKLDGDGKLYVQFACDGAKRMHSLINAILEYSELGSAALSYKPTSLAKCFHDATENLSIQIADTGAKITASELPTLPCPEKQLTLIFQNLLSNAMKFQKKGIPPKIRVEALERDVDWLFSIQDNGIGIDENYLQKVFKLFRRFHDRSVYPGSGIGLATCERILDRLGGKIWVESEVGKGSTFFFTLPKEPVSVITP